MGAALTGPQPGAAPSRWGLSQELPPRDAAPASLCRRASDTTAGSRTSCSQQTNVRARSLQLRGPTVLLAPTEGPARVSSDTVTSPGFAKANECASERSRVWRGACGEVATRRISGSPTSPASKQRPGSACPTDDPLQRGAMCAGCREGRTGARAQGGFGPETPDPKERPSLRTERSPGSWNLSSHPGLLGPARELRPLNRVLPEAHEDLCWVTPATTDLRGFPRTSDRQGRQLRCLTTET